MRGGAAAAWLACALSLSLHALWLWWSTAREPSFERSPAAPAIELEIVTGRTVAAAPRKPPRVSTAESPPPGRSRPRPGARRNPVTPLPPEPALEPVPTQPQQPTSRASGAAPAPARLSPREAALTMLEVNAADSGGEAQDAKVQETERTMAPADPATHDAAARLQEALDAVSQHVPHLEKRAPPVLRRRADGYYHYEGHVFEADIAPDGHVSFEDRATLGFPSFDLTDFVEHTLLGRELYAAEKRWFLAQTRALRSELSATAKAEEVEHARLRVRGRVLRIFEDPTLALGEKKQAVFALWAECTRDGAGAGAKQVIEASVRELFPQGSEMAYTEQELRALNAGRSAREAFAPYNI